MRVQVQIKIQLRRWKSHFEGSDSPLSVRCQTPSLCFLLFTLFVLIFRGKNKNPAMSRQSVRTVKTTFTSGGSSGMSIGGGTSGAVGGYYSSGSVVGGGGFNRTGSMGGRYAMSAIASGSSRPMSISTYGSRYGSSGGNIGVGAGGLIFTGGAGFAPAMTISKVQVNQSLLAPVQLDFDPTIQEVRIREKDQIKTLNNRFASMIDRVSDASRFFHRQLSNKCK